MEITGKIIELILDTQVPKKDGGSYLGARLTFRDTRDDKIKEKGFHQMILDKTPSLKNGLNNLASGDDFSALAEKEGEFWNWKSISKGIPTPSPINTSGRSESPPKTPSTYATAEERAQTQKYIVRQSSITAALKLLELQGKKSIDQLAVISLAEQFEAWVMGVKTQTLLPNSGDFSDIESDII